jgi:hypothetical protein
MSQPRRKMPNDAELRRQITAAEAAGVPVSATFTLRTPPGKTILSPEETRTMVQGLVRRAERETDARAQVNVFENLQSFAVEAPPKLITHLASQPEVEGAHANERREDLLIRPVRRERVALDPSGGVTRPLEGRTKRAPGGRRKKR